MLRTVDNIVLGFSTPKIWNPISWLVRLLTRSKASHVWVAYYDPILGIDVVVEAHEFGFRMIRYDRFIVLNNIVAIFRLPYTPPEVMSNMSRWLGSTYDFLGLIGLGAVKLAAMIGLKHLRNPFKSADAVFCSESIVRTLKSLDSDRYRDLDENNTTPQDLLEYMASHSRCY